MSVDDLPQFKIHACVGELHDRLLRVHLPEEMHLARVGQLVEGVKLSSAVLLFRALFRHKLQVLYDDRITGDGHEDKSRVEVKTEVKSVIKKRI